MADDDVLLQPQQVVPRAADRRVGQHARGLLERRRRNERLRRQARLGDPQEQRLVGRRLAALLHDPVLGVGEGLLVHVLPLQELRVTGLDDLHLLQHLAHDHADVLVVDLHALQPVHLLHFVQEVLLHRPVPSTSEIVAGSFGRRASNSSATRGRPPVMSRVLYASRDTLASTSPAYTSWPSSTVSCAPSGMTKSRSRFSFSPFFCTTSMWGCSFLSRSSMMTRWRRPVSSSSSSRTVSSSTMSTNRTTPATSVMIGLVYGSHVNNTPSFPTLAPSSTISVAPRGTWNRECTASTPVPTSPWAWALRTSSPS